MDKRKKDHVISTLGIVLVSFGLPVLYLVTGIMALLEARRIQAKLQVEKFFAGPSGYMSIIGVVLLLLFIPEIIEGMKKYKKNLQKYAEKQAISKASEETEAEKERRINTNRMWIVFLMLTGYIVIMKPLGFFISSIAFLITSMFYLGNKWLTVLITVSVVAVFLYFCPNFGITLPKGFLGI